MFHDICRVEVPDDGVQFDVDSIFADAIRAQQEYAGVRVELRASLAGAVVRVQVDVGFGDAVDPTEPGRPNPGSRWTPASSPPVTGKESNPSDVSCSRRRWVRF